MNKDDMTFRVTNRDIINYVFMMIDDKYAAQRILDTDSKWLDMTPYRLRIQKAAMVKSVSALLSACEPFKVRGRRTHKVLSERSIRMYWDSKAKKIAEAENFGRVPSLHEVERLLKRAMHPEMPAESYWRRLLGASQ